ncbi:MAG: hypothetical protein MOP51_424 [Citricoccus sp.]|nr:hypothetical protein [Citricoccus sp. WCRC_4]
MVAWTVPMAGGAVAADVDVATGALLVGVASVVGSVPAVQPVNRIAATAATPSA